MRTTDGATHDCDLLVYGTGFAATDFLVESDHVVAPLLDASAP